MPWTVEYTDEFGNWWSSLSEDEQESVAAHRVLYAFDPRRVALLLIGGDKTGNDRWYIEYVPIADWLYDEHLQILRQEGLF